MGKLSSLLAGAMKSKSTKRKEEYARYINTYARAGQPTKKMQSYAQWHEDKYGKYEKKKATPVKGPEPRLPWAKTTRTKAVDRGLKEADIDWEKDKPTKKYNRSK
jgi:hypothetical protein